MRKALGSIATYAAIWSVGIAGWRVLEGTFNGLTTIVSLVAFGLVFGSFIYFLGLVLEKWVSKRTSDKKV